jgi:hypothetical protein
MADWQTKSSQKLPKAREFAHHHYTAKEHDTAKERNRFRTEARVWMVGDPEVVRFAPDNFRIARDPLAIRQSISIPRRCFYTALTTGCD